MNATRLSAIEDGEEPTRCEIAESMVFAAGALVLAAAGACAALASILGAMQ